MKKKWITPILIFGGALVLLFAAGISEKLPPQDTVWFKIIGIILLMMGMYRASKRTDSPQEEDDTHADENENRG